MARIELEVPTEVTADSDSVELLRAWSAGGGLTVSLTWDMWDDTRNWGIFLVDVARHIANAHSQEKGVPTAVTLEGIRAAFDAEWEQATDTPEGSVRHD